MSLLSTPGQAGHRPQSTRCGRRVWCAVVCGVWPEEEHTHFTRAKSPPPPRPRQNHRHHTKKRESDLSRSHVLTHTNYHQEYEANLARRFLGSHSERRTFSIRFLFPGMKQFFPLLRLSSMLPHFLVCNLYGRYVRGVLFFLFLSCELNLPSSIPSQERADQLRQCEFLPRPNIANFI